MTPLIVRLFDFIISPKTAWLVGSKFPIYSKVLKLEESFGAIVFSVLSPELKFIGENN